MEKKYVNIERELPLVALRGLAIFPYMILSFDVGREISLNALESAMEDDEMIFLTSQKDSSVDEPTSDDYYHTGTVCKIKQLVKLPGDGVRVLVEGISRGVIKEINQEKPYIQVTIDEIVYDMDSIEDNKEIQATVRNVFDAFEEYINISNRVSPDILATLSEMDNENRFVDTIAANMFLKPEQKQEILDEFEIQDRLELILRILLEEIELLKIEKKIALKVKKSMNKVQKDYYLREQLKAIQKELGEDEDIDSEVEEYRKKLQKLKIPKESKEKISKEIDKFSKLSPMAPDSAVSRNYLETIFSLPWNKETKDKLDIKRAEEILNNEHYGLDKVKERIIEYLAIRKLSKTLKGPILCLVGPPGVGKTSIAKSIANSLDRKFVRISLGGVRDEAEIRGHRRTYVGAIPGRFVYGLAEAKSKNPLMLLDEIDKMSNDFKGDPAAAILEILDSNQNNAFKDHYLEIPVDLSNVLFVATANTLNGIPKPLLDRMEIIEVGSYTVLEKVEIAQKYLLPSQLEKHHLTKEQVKITKANFAISDGCIVIGPIDIHLLAPFPTSPTTSTKSKSKIVIP